MLSEINQIVKYCCLLQKIPFLISIMLDANMKIRTHAYGPTRICMPAHENGVLEHCATKLLKRNIFLIFRLIAFHFQAKLLCFNK